MKHYPMTEEFEQATAIAMLEKYCKALHDRSYSPERFPDIDSLLAVNIYKAGDKTAMLKHAAWMCEECKKFIRQHRWSKTYRWLGMIQGIMWVGGFYSLGQIRDHNYQARK